MFNGCINSGKKVTRNTTGYMRPQHVTPQIPLIRPTIYDDNLEE